MTCAPDKSSPVVLKTRSKKFTYPIQAPDPPTFLQENLKQFTTSGDKFVFSLPSSENDPSRLDAQCSKGVFVTKTALSAKCPESTEKSPQANPFTALEEIPKLKEVEYEQSLQTNLFAASSSDMTCAPDKSSPVVLKTRSKKFTYPIQAPDPPTFLQENLKQFTTSGDKFVFSLPSSENGPSSEALSPKRLESTEQSLQISTVCLP